jgi:ADP-ribose pyrophosphatase
MAETVAGVLEPGETPEAAVRRETLEETGYEIASLEPIATFYLSPGGSSERILLYYAEVLTSGKVDAGGGVPGENEDVKTVEYSPEEWNMFWRQAKFRMRRQSSVFSGGRPDRNPNQSPKLYSSEFF